MVLEKDQCYMEESVLDELSGPSSIGRREDLGSIKPQGKSQKPNWIQVGVMLGHQAQESKTVPAPLESTTRIRARSLYGTGSSRGRTKVLIFVISSDAETRLSEFR